MRDRTAKPSYSILQDSRYALNPPLSNKFGEDKIVHFVIFLRTLLTNSSNLDPPGFA